MADDKPCVLVIDDEEATLTMFSLFLKTYGYRVLLAQDGKTGLELAKREMPPIVFTDIKMPEMDGFDVLRGIKRHSPRTEVIVITGHGDMDLMLQALNLDATDFINKPIRRTALESALFRVTQRLQMDSPERGTVCWQIQGRTGVITVRGTLRRENRDDLAVCCHHAESQDLERVVFEFDDTATVSGSGISELTNALSRLRRKNIPIAFEGLSETFQIIFDMVGITRFAVLKH